MTKRERLETAIIGAVLTIAVWAAGIGGLYIVTH